MSDINLVDLGNSSITPLGVSGVFTGVYTDVTNFSSISIMVVSDRASATNGVTIQWSTDGVNLDDEQRFIYEGFASEQGRFIYAPIRARFVRMKYTNSSLAQSFFRLQTLLRRGPVQGLISPAGIDITTEADAVSTNSVLIAQRLSTPSDLVHLKTDDNAFLIVANRQNNNIVQNETTVTAQTAFSQGLDFFGIFAGTRVHFHVFNDTIRGNLFIRYGGSASLSSWTVKVPPQHLYEAPYSWGTLGASINGIWDVADGFARCSEWF